MGAGDRLTHTYDGYTLVSVVATGSGETLYTGERVRDGDPIWVRVADGDASTQARFRERYEAEQAAARQLASTGAVLPVRELIMVDGAPALVTDVPRGRSLNDHFSDSSKAPPIAETLPWLRKVMATLQAAHDEDATHGSLTGRAVYLDEAGRVTVCGVAVTRPEELAAAQSRDVRALAALFYHATTGRPPQRGFPDTGAPVSPQKLVDNYPNSLARFLLKRLDDEEDTAVPNAGVFRRSIDALAVDPEFRKVAKLGGERAAAGPNLVIQPPSARQRYQSMALGGFGLAAVIGVSVLVTMYIMNARVLEARSQAGASDDGPHAESDRAAPPPPLTARLAVWRCLHTLSETPETTLTPRNAAHCLRLAPDLTAARLTGELDALSTALTAALSRNATASGDGYRKMFGQGTEAVLAHVRYRLGRQLKLSALEAWVYSNHQPTIMRVVREIASRDDSAGTWAQALVAGIEAP